jgi:Papain family cysteine protease
LQGTGYLRDAEDVDFLANEGIAFDDRMLGAVQDRPQPFNPVGVLPTEDQRQRESCAGHFIQAAQQYAEFRQTGRIVRPSRWLAYLLAQSYSGTLGRDGGATIAGAVKGATACGNCLEEEYPYPADADPYTSFIPSELRQKALGHRMGCHAFLSSAEGGGPRGTLAWLRMQLGGVGFGIRWWDSFAGNQTGVLSARDYGIGNWRGHAVFVVCEAHGLGNDGKPRCWLKNPWGPSWGYQGWAVVEWSLLERWFADSYTVACGLSHLNPWQAKQQIDRFMTGGVYQAGPAAAQTEDDA